MLGASRRLLQNSAKRIVDDGEIDALAGMHTSDVRDAIAQSLKGRIPYIYTPLYEGGVNSSRVWLYW